MFEPLSRCVSSHPLLLLLPLVPEPGTELMLSPDADV